MKSNHFNVLRFIQSAQYIANDMIGTREVSQITFCFRRGGGTTGGLQQRGSDGEVLQSQPAVVRPCRLVGSVLASHC